MTHRYSRSTERPIGLKTIDPSRYPEDFYSTDFMTDKILEYTGESKAGQPFFAYMG